jgi:putative hemolysin
MTVYILAILVCLIFSGFFSASEMAYSSCNRVRLENARDGGSRQGGLWLCASRRSTTTPSPPYSSATTLSNIAASSLGSVAVIMVFKNEDYAWISTVIITILVIIFGETVPKIAPRRTPTAIL